jgi:hypothetical protein
MAKTKKPTCPNVSERDPIHIVKPEGCLTCANYDEIGRFNASVKAMKDAGTPLLIDSPDSLNHGDEVLYMQFSFDLVTKRPKDSNVFTRTWSYCNDGRWATLLKRAGVVRHPMNAAHTAR